MLTDSGLKPDGKAAKEEVERVCGIWEVDIVDLKFGEDIDNWEFQVLEFKFDMVKVSVELV